MIKNVKTIIGLFLVTLVLFGCVRDGVDECPAGDIRLHFFVEKFQNKSQNPLDDREDVFSNVVGHLRYYLYKDGSLFREGMVSDFNITRSNCYSMEYTDLEYGSYEMVVIANCTQEALEGDCTDPTNLVLTYPGCEHTEDYFTSVFAFDVKSDQSMDYEVGLSRVQGASRYTFKNIPEEIDHIEIIVDNVSHQKWVKGDYENSCTASQKYTIIPLTRMQSLEGYVIKSFPTLSNEYSTFYLNLYTGDSEEPYRQEVISGDLSIIRNQLLDLEVTFDNESGISFEILLDNSWEGSSPGGETGIQ